MAPLAKAGITTGIAQDAGHESGGISGAIASSFVIVPEPSTWAALIMGTSILLLRSRKRRS